MATLNEVKEQMITVASVGDFANAMQQIATLRMMKARERVVQSRPFVEEAVQMLRELTALREQHQARDLGAGQKLKKGEKASSEPTNARRAVIVITSNQGLTGRYNIEIYQKLEKLIQEEKNSDFFIIGKKGQETFANGKYKVEYFPYEVGENFTIKDLKRIIALFDYYGEVRLLYSRFVNTAKRDVVVLSVVTPILEEDEQMKKQPGRFMYEPNIFQLIDSVGHKLRGALFQQQIMDARLSQYAAQMIGMKTAADNSVELMKDMKLEYNKARRKMIDKKIGEVFAGSALW
jgi:F-type H+-transporting ATPase subunit gamma